MTNIECPFSGQTGKACNSGEYGKCLLLHLATAEKIVSQIEKDPDGITTGLSSAQSAREAVDSGAFSADPYRDEILEQYNQAIGNYQRNLPADP